MSGRPAKRDARGRRIYRTDWLRRFKAQARRERRRSAGHCVNHDNRPATHGCRCADCDAVHRRTSARAPLAAITGTTAR